jgi:hypothetical protein
LRDFGITVPVVRKGINLKNAICAFCYALLVGVVFDVSALERDDGTRHVRFVGSWEIMMNERLNWVAAYSENLEGDVFQYTCPISKGNCFFQLISKRICLKAGVFPGLLIGDAVTEHFEFSCARMMGEHDLLSVTMSAKNVYMIETHGAFSFLVPSLSGEFKKMQFYLRETREVLKHVEGLSLARRLGIEYRL